LGKQLAVILGAGASFDSARRSREAGVNWAWKPPLATELFHPGDAGLHQPVSLERQRNFESVLARYPRARSLANEGYARLRSSENLESVLRSWRDGEDFVVRKFQQVPLYLQDLLGSVSMGYVPTPNSTDNYDALVGRLLAADFDKVVFITLNYDLLLERSLVTAGDVNPKTRQALGLNWYTQASANWIMIKLHGSVDWGRPITSHVAFNNDTGMLLDQLEDLLIRDCEVGPVELLPHEHRSRVRDGVLLYPALAVPVDDDYEAICPRDQLDQARAFLRSCTNFLVIGARAKDHDLLELLRESTVQVEELCIVAGSEEGARESFENLLTGSLDIRTIPLLVGKGLNSFVESGGFSHFIDTLK
jgi:hypothetical protein